MRVLAAALAVLLLVAISSVAEGSLGNSKFAASSQKPETIPISCCVTYISRRVPLSLIQSAYVTSSSCPNPAVVLVTKKGRNLCADPKAPWVKKYLMRFELQEH